MNISDLCVCTALPVKHFRSLVHKMCSDRGKLHRNRQSNEYTLTAPQAPVGWQISKPEPEIPFWRHHICARSFLLSDLQNESWLKGCHSLLPGTVAAPLWQSMFF